MKKSMLIFLLALVFALSAACALAVPAYDLEPISANPATKLSFRSGPGTDYTELFSITKDAVTDFVVYQQEKQ